MNELTKEQSAELVNLYHLARTALSGKDDSKYARKIWASKEYAKITGLNTTMLYKQLDRLVESGGLFRNPKPKNVKRKKPRTAAQKAATARMLAGLKRKRGTKGTRKVSTLTAARIAAAHRSPVKRRTVKRRAVTVSPLLAGRYCVKMDGKIIAVFKMVEMAKMYARALHNSKPGHTVTVET